MAKTTSNTRAPQIVLRGKARGGGGGGGKGASAEILDNLYFVSKSML
jgi:hypothetical protein